MAKSYTTTVAKTIAIQLNLVGEYWPALIQGLSALSRPARRQLYNFFTSQLAVIRSQMYMFNSQLNRADLVADKINLLHSALTEMLIPVDDLLRNMPLDTVFKEIPEMSDLYSDITAFVPVAIPAAVSDLVANVIGPDVFDGISTYQDLKDKLDELLFRASRITSLKTYASKGIYLANEQIEKIQKIIDILVTLDAEL